MSIPVFSSIRHWLISFGTEQVEKHLPAIASILASKGNEEIIAFLKTKISASEQAAEIETLLAAVGVNLDSLSILDAAKVESFLETEWSEVEKLIQG